MEYNQLALVPRQNFSNVIPNALQDQVPKPQLPGWTPYYPPEASTSAPPRRSPIKARLADRSRLAKDILKQLGRPPWSPPTVPTRHRHQHRKESEAGIAAASAQPPVEPVVPESRLLNYDGPPLPPGIVPVPDQVAPSSSYATYPPETPVGDPPLLDYPDTDPGPAPRNVGATDQVIHMDSAFQPPASLGSNLPQYPVSSPVVPGSAPATEEGSTVERPLSSTPPPLKRRGPPPDAEIIEISDDEDQATARVVTTTTEPMEVDEEIGTDGAVSQSLSVMETGEGPTGESLSRRPAQELIGRKPQKNLASVELPPLPAYARQNRGKERAPVQEEDDEGCMGASVCGSCS